jgi:hypothetical protein
MKGPNNNTQGRTTAGRTPLDEWSARHRDLYLTTHTTHNGQPSMPPAGFRTRNPSKRSAVDMHLRPLGHWDRRVKNYNIEFLVLAHMHELFVCGNSWQAWAAQHRSWPTNLKFCCSPASQVERGQVRFHVTFILLLWFKRQQCRMPYVF